MTPKGYVALTFATIKEKPHKYSAVCVELGTAVQASTKKAAKELIENTALAQLNALEKYNQRIRYFRKHNIEYFATKRSSNELSMTPMIIANLAKIVNDQFSDNLDDDSIFSFHKIVSPIMPSHAR